MVMVMVMLVTSHPGSPGIPSFPPAAGDDGDGVACAPGVPSLATMVHCLMMRFVVLYTKTPYDEDGDGGPLHAEGGDADDDVI